jgi:class 3 adenylate cyclase
MSQTRRLAAILAADVAGYSQLMGTVSLAYEFARIALATTVGL